MGARVDGVFRPLCPNWAPGPRLASVDGLLLRDVLLLQCLQGHRLRVLQVQRRVPQAPQLRLNSLQLGAVNPRGRGPPARRRVRLIRRLRLPAQPLELRPSTSDATACRCRPSWRSKACESDPLCTRKPRCHKPGAGGQEGNLLPPGGGKHVEEGGHCD